MSELEKIMDQTEKLIKITQLLSKYAIETHWYINATNKELRENDDNPTKSFTRCADIELELKKLGYEFPKITKDGYKLPEFTKI